MDSGNEPEDSYLVAYAKIEVIFAIECGPAENGASEVEDANSEVPMTNGQVSSADVPTLLCTKMGPFRGSRRWILMKYTLFNMVVALWL